MGLTVALPYHLYIPRKDSTGILPTLLSSARQRREQPERLPIIYQVLQFRIHLMLYEADPAHGLWQLAVIVVFVFCID